MSKTSQSESSAPRLGVFIGRFQFFHNGHLDAIRQGLAQVDYLVVQIGSSNQPRTYFNPFSFEERSEVIMASLTPEEANRVICLPLEDIYYNDQQWIQRVQANTEQAVEHWGLPSQTQISLVGFRKDGTSYYLNMFPLWGETPVENNTGLSATPIRAAYFLDDEFPHLDDLPKATLDFLKEFFNHPEYNQIYDEYRFIADYQAPYANLPYPPIFVTTDAVVIQSGYILLIRRRDMPGKGLWALPGGFLQADMRVVDNIFKELIEESGITYDVPETILRARLREVRVYDAVHRSARGRTVTHAGLIVLETPPKKNGSRVLLPRVRGSDDADRAQWFPLAGPGAIEPSQVFEDHYSIIQDITAEL